MKKRAFFHVILVILITAKIAPAQPIDTVHIGNGGISALHIRPGTKQFIVYRIDSATGHRIRPVIWTRKISFEGDGETRNIVIDQQFESGDSTFSAARSVSRSLNFRPVYQWELNAGKPAAYNFYPDRIVGADTVPNNQRKDFSLALTEPTFNWNLDMEILPALTLAAGKKFAINFYQPGSPFKPEYYLHEVKRKAQVTMADGAAVNCWVLVLHYTSTDYAEFYITEKTHDLIKVLQYGRGRLVRCKISLAAAQ